MSELIDIGAYVLLALSCTFSREGVRYYFALASVCFHIAGAEEGRRNCDESIVEIAENGLAVLIWET